MSGRRLPGLVAAAVAVVLMTTGAGPGGQLRTSPTQQGPQNREEAGSSRRVEFAAPGGAPLALDIFYPALDGAPRPGIVLVHGGGWRREGRGQLVPLAERLRDRLGVVVATIDYRLDVFPSGFPAEVDDVDAAIRWMRESAAEWDVDPERIALIGSSAGANLALVAGLRETGPQRVAAVVALSAPVDLVAMRTTAEGRQTDEYLGCAPSACPDLYDAASPLTYVSEDDPPVLVVNGVGEQIPADQATVLHDTLEATGVPSQLVLVAADGHGHGLADDVENELGAFLASTLGVAPPPRVPTVSENTPTSEPTGTPAPAEPSSPNDPSGSTSSPQVAGSVAKPDAGPTGGGAGLGGLDDRTLVFGGLGVVLATAVVAGAAGYSLGRRHPTKNDT